MPGGTGVHLSLWQVLLAAAGGALSPAITRLAPPVYVRPRRVVPGRAHR
ncbi:hypothetical protein San01_50810 [Streptomyces angustmyceticus]|uniref:Uncharacterized protein n=1 Tax=Streptomyces angustmyceticus TaxID=285578 RepID=A0A5J4LJC4_9ACTN|nr:hypothetical protein San01_50810 [Streptomyces angustmyceticus]